ncbi:MAG: radical SAM protein [Magnetococcus sp. YQC-9]
MVHYQNGFRSHLDLINKLRIGQFLDEVPSEKRLEMLSVWNLPGFVGLHLDFYLRQFGIVTRVINNFDSEWPRLEQLYQSSSTPPLVGISTTFHLTFTEIRRMTQRLRDRFPAIELVIGGAFVHDRFSAEGVEGLAKPMRKFGIDFAIHSVNSETDLKDLLLARRAQVEDYTRIHNLIHCHADRCLATQERWNEPVLFALPFEPEKNDWPFINRTVATRTTAGCSFSCAFCSYPEVAHGFHKGEIDAVEQQLQQLLRIPNVDRIIFLDDTPNIPKPRWDALCRMFTRYEFEWFSFLRVQYIDDDLAALMRASGCRGVYLGVESADDQVLKNMNKKATREKYLRGIASLKKHGITTMAAFVLGFPGETEQTIEENIQFIENSGLDFYSLKEFYYMENTPVHAQRERFGLTGSGNNWSHATMDSATAYQHKLAMLRRIRNCVFIDPDTSLWYLAYLYDQGFAMQEIAMLQREINGIMIAQMDGDLSDRHPGFDRLSAQLANRSNFASKETRQ